MKPIIGAQGEFVTLPACDAVVFYPQSYRGGWSVKIDQAKYLYEDGIESDDLAVLDYYATREAAEMALIRAKALQRLKVLAYGDGWLPDLNDDSVEDKFGIYYSTFSGDFVVCGTLDMDNTFGIYFEAGDKAETALKSLTIQEREAFLYIHKPTEGK
tara:strand:- start:72 stop:542 length:471 start_codon:yes stop_codon:yes gene_type:complete